jgi:hypothetical protein
VLIGTQASSLAAAALSLKEGDVLDVYPLPNEAPYPAVKFTKAGSVGKPIVVRGVTVNGVRPVIQGGGSVSTNYAAVSFNESDHMLLENVTVTNGIQRRNSNGDFVDTSEYYPDFHECVRNRAHDVTLRNVLVTGCANNGVFATDERSGSLTLDRVEINGSGCDHQTQGAGMQCRDVAHAVYVATDLAAYPSARLRIVDSVIRNNNAGVAIKSRAHRLEVYNSWVLVSHSKEVQAVNVFGHDNENAPLQASLDHPIHADLVGNVFLVDSSTTLANGVIRSGSDFEPSENNADTFGRVRLVNNTFVLAGDMTSGDRSRPIVRFFGRSEGLMAFNNLAVVAGSPNGKVVFMSEDFAEPDSFPAVWVAPDGLPRVMLSHNSQLPDGSFVWAERTGENYTMDRTPPNGFAWSDWVPSSRKLQDGDLRKVDRQTLRDLLTPSLRAGTTATNPAVHPAGGNRAFAIPDALPLPTREPAAPGAAPGQISTGAPRDDAATPTLGALQ